MAATLIINGSSFPFLTAVTDRGWPLDTTDMQEEVLESPGVNGRRWRSVAEQHRAFVFRTLAGVADFKAAVDLANAYVNAVRINPLARLLVSSGTRADSWINVHISAADPHPVNGVVGGDATGLGASVVTSWAAEHTG